MASGVFAWGVGKKCRAARCCCSGRSAASPCCFTEFSGGSICRLRAGRAALKGRKSVVVTWDEPLEAALSASLSKHGNEIVAQLVIRDDDDRLNDAIIRLANFVRGASIDEIFLVPRISEPNGFGKVLEALRILPFPVILVPDLQRQPNCSVAVLLNLGRTWPWRCSGLR